MIDPYSQLAVFAAHWDQISRLMNAETLRKLRETLSDLRAEGPGAPDRWRTAESARRLVLNALPEAEAGRFTPETARFAEISSGPDAVFEGFGVDDLVLQVVDRNPMVGPVLGSVRDRLMRSPMLARRQVPGLGDGRAEERLIRLSDARGVERYPAFQFREDDGPWATVLEINELLDCAHDAWGAADWWLSDNSWLGTSPASLLGQGRDEELRGAALALLDQDGGT